MVLAYAIAAAIAVALLIVYIVAVRPKDCWMLLLFSSVCIINGGYLLLSLAECWQSLPFAQAANSVVYFGSVFLSPSLYMTVRHLCGERRNRRLVWALMIVALMMFAIVATTPLTGWYYKEVFFSDAHGYMLFSKSYGPLHPVYKVYLIGLFVAMAVTVIRSLRRQRFPSQKQAALISAIVFGNIAFWLAESFLYGPFEYMSVFYLFSEVLLLGLHWLMQDTAASAPVTPMEHLLSLLPEGVALHPREQEILELILANEKRKEIAAKLNLSENTVKTYIRNLYRKFDISSREELFALLP